MRISIPLPASFRRRLESPGRWISRVRARFPKLAPAEKAALLAIVSVLGLGGALRAWERSGVSIGPVDDWKSLRELIVQARESHGGGYPCAIDELPGFSGGATSGAGSDGENILAAGALQLAGSFKPRGKNPSGKKAPPARPLDLNAASEKALLSLPGVGPSTAKAIVAYRAAQGPFRSVDDLLQVKGIGPKKLESLRPYARVAAPADTPVSAPPR